MDNIAPISVENLRRILHGNKIKVRKIETVYGPTVTLYKVYPEAGTRISRVRVLEDDISLAIQSASIRIIVLDDCFGIEIANFPREKVTLKSMLSSQQFTDAQSKMILPIIIGMNTYRETEIADLTKLHHLLVAGDTKQDISSAIHAIIQSLLNGCSERLKKIVMIDLKSVDNALVALDAMKQEMEVEYNRQLSGEKMMYSVMIIDEYGDHTAGDSYMEKRIQASILELAQKGHQVGIHLILATRQLSTRIITGLIKANFPARLAVRVPTKEDSRLILDTDGAEKLLGSGDAIFSTDDRSVRVQIANS